ncbi:SDR family NAD(P)-dependent oxidoreductase [Candidatus Poriferisocius sp.]|uniref:SDR family NAD(P)-dependent oxidoreductase n=1 Tax=Candidatus Poriferisocius sp. TaxID=3101276 RepID=UPI003B01BCD7
MTALPADLLDLTGKVVVVTGAGGGIGAGIVRRMAADGASVVAHTRSSAVDLSGGEAIEVRADLTAEDGPATVVSAAREHFGRIDALVNNAGIQPVAPFTELDDQQWAEMIDTNLTAVHRLTRAAASAMADQGTGGSIVHVASIEARHPTPVHGHYATAKAGLVMHAKAAALAWGPHGIRANSVSPGLINRPGLAEDWPEGVGRWMAAVPLGRMGTPEDVGDACVFLCSDLARWITGADLVVDGGILTNPTW